MREIKAIVRTDRLEDVLDALHGIDGLPGVTISAVRGVGRAHGADADAVPYGEVQMAKLEVVVEAAFEATVVRAIIGAAQTGRHDDGKIFISQVNRVIRIRTGEEDREAL